MATVINITNNNQMTTSSSTQENVKKIHLRWENICYDVAERHQPSKSKSGPIMKRILHSVSGQVAPGEVVAIMGPSGSGKTSLLNILADQVHDGVTGNILINGNRIPKSFLRLVGYVKQDDKFFNALTVSEALMYTARLKLPVGMSKQEKKIRCDELLKELDLVKCANTRIGEVGQGISGGERRRLAIAMQIINKPSLLLLDEPTSGLDSASALMIVETLNRLARTRSCSVVCTIHQPRAAVFGMFDKIFLLAEGKTVYFGPSLPQCLTFFRDAGYPAPQYENPADYLLDLINTKDGVRTEGVHTESETSTGSVDVDQENKGDAASSATVVDVVIDNNKIKKLALEDRKVIIERLHQAYKQSDFAVQNMSEYPNMPPPIQESPDQPRYLTPFWNQLVVVTSRSFFYKLREPFAAMTQMFNATVLPLLIGTIFWNLPETSKGATDRLSAISLVMLLQSFFAFDIIMLFPLERDIYLREQLSGLYRTSAYYIGRSLAEMPLHLFFTFIVATISYWCIGFQADLSKFMTWVILLESETLAGASMLICFGALARKVEQSNLLASFFILLFMLFDGSWISQSNIPRAYRWIGDLSFIGYGVKAGIKNELSGLVLSCPQEEISLYGKCEFATGEEVMQAQGYANVSIGMCILWLWVTIFVYRVIAYFGLRFLYTGKSFKERLLH